MRSSWVGVRACVSPCSLCSPAAGAGPQVFVGTGNGVSLNTSLNRRGEPMICSPTDALNMFFGSDLQYLIMEDILVVKDGAAPYDQPL